MNGRTLIGLSIVALALVGCGGRQPLKPVTGQSLPAIPVGATTAPTSTTPGRPMSRCTASNCALAATASSRRQSPRSWFCNTHAAAPGEPSAC